MPAGVETAATEPPMYEEQTDQSHLFSNENFFLACRCHFLPLMTCHTYLLLIFLKQASSRLHKKRALGKVLIDNSKEMLLNTGEAARRLDLSRLPNTSSLSVNCTKGSFNTVQRLKAKVTQTIFEKVERGHLPIFRFL